MDPHLSQMHAGPTPNMQSYTLKINYVGSGCVAQLVQRSLPMPEVRGSNPVIGKIY